MKKLFLLLASAICILAISSCKLPTTDSTYSLVVYKCTASTYNNKIAPKLSSGTAYTAAQIDAMRASLIPYSVLVTSTTEATRSEIYSLLISKGFTKNQANTALDYTPTILAATTTDSSYPYAWIYIEKNN